MKMEIHEDSYDSFPYIDDSPTEEETTPHQYNLRISENYQNKNRNIEITNRLPKDIVQYLNPVAPMTEDHHSNNFQEEANKETQKQIENLAASGMKLVIKGWHSSISIQGLDNKSSITFKRRCEKLHKKDSRNDERVTKTNTEESKLKRGRWKMLTKSLMLTRSGRFERRGLDERYPKYVLLKNEDEELTKVKENYPKMFIFNEKKQKENAGFRSEFNLKKSFKNKTEPIVSMEKILNNAEEDHDRKPKEITKAKKKQPLTQRCRNENRNLTIKKSIVVERKKNLKPDEHSYSEPAENPLQNIIQQNYVCSEIQGIFEDDLKLLPQNLELQQPDGTRQPQKDMECCDSVPPHYCRFSCTDPYYCLGPPNQTVQYVPACSQLKHVYKNPNTLQCDNAAEEQSMGEGEVNLENLPFGLLSSFFPRVVIMKTIQTEDLTNEDGKEMTSIRDCGPSKFEMKDPEPQNEDDGETFQGLQVPQQDLTLKSKMVQQPVKTELEDLFLNDIGPKESSSSDEELKTKTQESEATTEYLQYSEFPDSSGNEAIERLDPRTPPPHYERRENTMKTLPTPETGDESTEKLSLTKIGYKMYDNLTKLSLNREKETMTIPEGSGCGCSGKETKKTPYNITFESSNNLVKVTVPENELNFQIVNSRGADIQIGVMSSERGTIKEEMIKEEKTIVRKDELWHSDGGGRALVLKNEGNPEAAFQKLQVSLANNKDVVLSIEMNEGDKKEEKTKKKHTKEMKVGTDDFDLAGGDFVPSGGNQKNLSPRIGRLLKHLHKKLESDERDRKFLDEKIEQKLLESGGGGVFLVKHISPTNQVSRKFSEVPALGRAKKGTERQEKEKKVREYYCEECLATMRILEDENPSVKSMVDKFETIIQLESF